MKAQSSRSTDSTQAQAHAFRKLDNKMFRKAHYQLYRARHYLRTPGGPGDMHDTLTSQFQRHARKRGVKVSDLVVGRIVAYWVNFWVKLMRQDQLPLGLRFTNEQKDRGNRRSARSRAKQANAHAYRAHALRRAGLSTKQIAAALGRSERSIRSYLATPFSTVQATRQRIVRPRPRPTLYPPAAAAICYLLIPPTKERSEKKTEPTDSKLPPPEEIDVLAELKTHWAAQDRQKSHNAPSRAPAKPTPETKIAYKPLTRKRF